MYKYVLCTSLERYVYGISSGACCIKVHAEIAEKSQVKYRVVFIFTDARAYTIAFFKFSH